MHAGRRRRRVEVRDFAVVAAAEDRARLARLPRRRRRAHFGEQSRVAAAHQPVRLGQQLGARIAPVRGVATDPVAQAAPRGQLARRAGPFVQRVELAGNDATVAVRRPDALAPAVPEAEREPERRRRVAAMERLVEPAQGDRDAGVEVLAVRVRRRRDQPHALRAPVADQHDVARHRRDVAAGRRGELVEGNREDRRRSHRGRGRVRSRTAGRETPRIRPRAGRAPASVRRSRTSRAGCPRRR